MQTVTSRVEPNKVKNDCSNFKTLPNIYYYILLVFSLKESIGKVLLRKQNVQAVLLYSNRKMEFQMKIRKSIILRFVLPVQTY